MLNKHVYLLPCTEKVVWLSPVINATSISISYFSICPSVNHSYVKHMIIRVTFGLF